MKLTVPARTWPGITPGAAALDGVVEAVGEEG